MAIRSFFNKGWLRVLLLIIPYLLVVGAFQILGYYVVGLEHSSDSDIKTTEQTLVIQSFTLFGTILLIGVFLKFFDKKKISDLGLSRDYSGVDTFTGIWLGMLIMLFGLIVLLLTGQVQITTFTYNIYEIILTVVLFIAVSLNEELLLRGYVLQNLMMSFNKYVALFISSALFSCMHLANPNVDFHGLADLFLAGILLGLCYIRTGSLWLPIALHFSWNFFQSLFGFNVSGIDFYSLVNISLGQETIWNGGHFGFEGSALSSIFQLPALVFVYLKYRFRTSYTNPISIPPVTNR